CWSRGRRARGGHSGLCTPPGLAGLIARESRTRPPREPARETLRGGRGGSSQKPRRSARERDDQEVARWVRDEFPRIVREAHRRRAYLAFLDESGFLLTPTVRRTLAPRGKTPVLSAWDRRGPRWAPTRRPRRAGAPRPRPVLDR